MRDTNSPIARTAEDDEITHVRAEETYDGNLDEKTLRWAARSITRKHVVDLERLVWFITGYLRKDPTLFIQCDRMIDMSCLRELPDILSVIVTAAGKTAIEK